MKKFNFQLNTILTAIVILITIVFTILGYDEVSIKFLIILGVYQVITSFIMTFISIITNHKILSLYIVYWLTVIVFFKFILENYLYSCILIALYNLYISYCSVSNSKYNITQL